MKFIGDGEITLCSYSIFDRFPSVLALTSTRRNSQSGSKNEKNCIEYDAGNVRLEQFVKLYDVQPDDFAYVKQEHSSKVIVTDTPGFLGNADGIITRNKGICLCVVTADCLPVFLYDSVTKAFGIVHAGWRGLAGNIIAGAINLMVSAFNTNPEDLFVAIGPFIQKCCYIVGNEVAEQFDEQCLISVNGEKAALDLGCASRNMLLRMCIPPDQIEISDECTCCKKELYHSFRREGKKAGRQISFITVR